MPQVHTFTLLPLLRKGKDPQQTEWPIFLRITIDGKPTEVSTKQAVDPLQWNQQKGRMRGNSERARIMNATIETLENRARLFYNEMVAKGKMITAQAIKNAILGVEQHQHSLIKLFDQHAAEIKKRIGVDYCKGTYILIN